MAHKRRPTAHQKQIRFLAICLGIILLLAVIGILLLVNQPVGGYHFHR